MSDLNYTINFNSNTQGLNVAEQGLNQLQNELSQTSQQANRADQSLDKMDKQSGVLGKTVGGLTNSLGGLTGLLATLGIGASLGELIALADTFNNLEAKVQLATKSGQDWKVAFEGVEQVANATFTSIESTTELYSKMAMVGNEMGMNQQQMLDLTKTINQAIQIGGSSAEQAQAGIMQMSQALMGGTVRAEEYNSMMENTPKVLQAVAKGLNMSMGQLREHMLEGKLSAEQFMSALQSQAGAIQSEFDRMPTTVDNAMQQLKNTVLSLVGDIDNQLNQSSGLATFIQGIAEQLDNLDPTTVDAIKEAFKQLGAVAKELWDTAGELGDTISTVWNAFDGTAQAGEKVGTLTKIVQELSIFLGHVSDGVKGISIVADGVFGGMIIGIGGVVSAYETMTGKTHEISDELLKKGDELLERAKKNALEFESSAVKAHENASKTMQQRLAETAEYAEEYAKRTAQSFEKVAQNSKATSEEIAKSFKEAVNYATTKEQVEALLTQLGELAKKGVIAGEQVAEGIMIANPKIIELEQKAKQTAQNFDELADAGDEVKSVTEQLADATKNLGLDFELASNKLSAGFNTSINGVLELITHFDALKMEGYNASELIMQGLAKATDTAKNKADIDLLTATINHMGKEGKLSAEQVAMAMDNINEKASKTPALLDETARAFKELGIISKAEAEAQAKRQIEMFELVKKSGQASAEQLAQALDKVQKSVEMSGNTAQQAWLESQQTALGLNDTLETTAHTADRVASSAIRIGDGVAEGVNRGISELERLNQAMDETARRNQALGEETKRQMQAREDNNKGVMASSLKDSSQYATRTAVENYYRQSGLDERQIRNLMGKLKVHQNGMIDWTATRGYRNGQEVDGNYKSVSSWLLEQAESIKFSRKTNVNPQQTQQPQAQQTTRIDVAGQAVTVTAPNASELAGTITGLISAAETRATENAKLDFMQQLTSELKRQAR